MRAVLRIGVASTFCIMFLAASVAVAQQPAGWNFPPPSMLQQGPPGIPPEMAGPYATGGSISDGQVPAGQPNPYNTISHENTASHELDIYQQPPASLEQQLAGLGKRIEALEKPAIKYPANVQVLGVFQADAVMFNQDAANKLPVAQGGVMNPGQPAGVTTIQNGADFRRARLAARGTLGNNINAFMQFDFAFPGRPTFTDLWVEYTDLPWLGTVRIGQWKQPSAWKSSAASATRPSWNAPASSKPSRPSATSVSAPTTTPKT